MFPAAHVTRPIAPRFRRSCDSAMKRDPTPAEDVPSADSPTEVLEVPKACLVASIHLIDDFDILVDPGNSSWNQLLTELSQLSRIVEQSANDMDHGSSSTAVPELAER